MAKRVVLGVAATLAALLAVAMLGAGLIETDWGEARLAAILGRVLSTPQERVTIAGLGGIVPFDVHVASITVADAAGPHLVIADAATALSVKDLLAGRVTLTRLSARRIDIARPAATSGKSGNGLAALLNPPLPVAVRELDLGTVFLGAPVLGTKLAFGIHGSLAAGGGRAKADVALRQIGGDGRVSLGGSYDGVRLTLDARASEPGGALLEALLHRAAPLPLDAHLAGAGPLDDWQGTLSLAAGNEASATARLTIAGAAPRRVTLDASATVAALLPPSLQPLAQGTITIAAAAKLGPGSFALDRLDITGPERVSAHGTYVRDGGAITGTGHLALADLAPLVDGKLSGSAILDATVSGTLAAPDATVTVDAQNLGTAQGKIEHAHALIVATGAKNAPIAVQANGTLDGIAAPSLPPDLAREATWRLAGHIDPRGETAAFDQVSLGDAGATVAGAVSASRSGARGTLALALDDLRPLDHGALGGALAAAADFRFGADGAGLAVVSGAISHATAAPRLEALLGPSVTFAGTVARGAAGDLTARNVAVAAAAVTLTGKATRSGDGHLAADVAARLARLDPSVAGAVSAEGHIEGLAEALNAQVTLSAPSLIVAGRRIDDFSAALDLPSLLPVRGTLAAHANLSGVAVALSGEGTLGKGAVTLSRVEATGAGARIGGTLTIAGTRIAGTLDGTIPNLAPFSPLAGTKLAGRATLAARAQGNTAEMTLVATGLAAFGANSERIRLAATVANPLTRPTGRATLAAANAALGATRLDDVKIVAQSAGADRVGVTASARGRAGQPFSLALGVSLARARGGADLSLARLTGRLGTSPFRLAAPLAASWRGAAARFSGLALDLGRGTLTGDGSVQQGDLALHLLARNLPVNALAGLANKEAEGELGFEIRLTGTRGAPQGSAVIDAENLRFAPAPSAATPALGIVLRADWRDGRVTLAGRLAGPRGGSLGWQGSAPLVLAREGFALSLPRAGALRFELQGNGDLGPISDLLPLGEDRLAGQFAVNVSVAGTVAQPEARGRLSVTGGRYENIASGAVLSGVSFALVGDRGRLDLVNFSANDGGSGRLALQGAVDLAALPPQFELRGTLNHFRALRRDEGTGTASGSFTLSGSVAAPRLAARLTIDEADIAVPEKLAPNLAPVAATEIDSALGTTLTQAAAPKPSPLETLALNVAVTLPGKTFVRGRGLDSEWRGSITVAGTTHAPVLKGHLDVVHGTFDFVGVTFNLTKGAIDFPGGQSIDPVIDIEATAQSSDITAIVDINGTATKPTIKLSSEPALPRDEILARLLFGTSMSQITAAEGLQLASAAASLAGGQSLDVLGNLRRGLGLDRLALGAAPSSVVPGVGVPSVGGTPGQADAAATGIGTTPLAPGSAAGGSLGGTALNAGKYVANGVYVGVSQGVGSNTSTVTVQVDVARHVTVDTEAGEASGSGVGVSWKLDY